MALDRKVMHTRIITGLIFGVVMIGCLLGGKISAQILLFVIGLGCVYEYIKMVKGQAFQYFIWMAVGSAIAISVMWYISDMPFPYRDVLILHIIGIITASFNLWKPVINHRSSYIVVGLFYIVLPLYMTMYTLESKAEHAQYLLFLFILIWVSDSAAYFVGSRWGKHKLFEKISPNKTWEGFLGAGLFTLVAAFLIGKLTSEIAVLYWMLAGIWVWIMGTMGDLFESSIKREFGFKDSGSILPGHGGFLDRFDSFLFVAAFGSWILVWQP